MPYFETSAKDAVNVDMAFAAAIRRVNALNLGGNMPRQDYTVDLKSSKSHGGGCCS